MTKKIKIFLTGGSGFIGRNILEQLGDKYEFIAPSRKELDLMDSKKVYKYVELNKPEVIMHAAFMGGSKKECTSPDDLKGNLIIFHNLLATSNHFGKIIIFGSGAEYDKRYDLCNVQEDRFGKNIPIDNYGLAKFTIASLVANNKSVTHLRFFGVFGKYEDYRIRFISYSICRALLGLNITINQNVYFDYIFIDDVVKIIDKVIDHNHSDIFYNVGSGHRIDLLSIARLIVDVIDKKLPIIVFEDGLNKEYSCSVDKLNKEFPDIDFTDMRNSIVKLIEYYREELPNIDKSIFLNKSDFNLIK